MVVDYPQRNLADQLGLASLSTLQTNWWCQRWFCCWILWLSLGLGVTGGLSPLFAAEEKKAAPPMPRLELAKRLEPILANPPTTGLLIFDVQPGSQADQIGLQVGDIITFYNGQPVASTAELVTLARAAAKQKEGNIQLVVQRQQKEIETVVSPAQIGIRLVEVERGQSRQLWRQPTAYQPDFRALRPAQAESIRWELLKLGNENVGYIRHYLKRHGERLTLRSQREIVAPAPGQKAKTLPPERTDVIITFTTASPFLPVRSIQVVLNEVTLLSLNRHEQQLSGTKQGAPTAADYPPDTVSAYLAGYVASTLPQKEGTCLRCSALGPNDVTPAPFADFFGEAMEFVQLGLDKPVLAFRFSHTVFGQIQARYWIDEQRQLLQTDYGNGLIGLTQTPEQIQAVFPGAGQCFPNPQLLPKISPTAN